eukprot:COSAG02_NODE_3745_length_6295_cov_288.344093_3_plen_84_part_00
MCDAGGGHRGAALWLCEGEGKGVAGGCREGLWGPRVLAVSRDRLIAPARPHGLEALLGYTLNGRLWCVRYDRRVGLPRSGACD